MAALNLITFADAAGSRVGVLLDGGRVLDLGVAMPPARDMISVIEAGAPMLAAISPTATPLANWARSLWLECARDMVLVFMARASGLGLGRGMLSLIRSI